MTATRSPTVYGQITPLTNVRHGRVHGPVDDDEDEEHDGKEEAGDDVDDVRAPSEGGAREALVLGPGGVRVFPGEDARRPAVA